MKYLATLCNACDSDLAGIYVDSSSWGYPRKSETKVIANQETGNVFVQCMTQGSFMHVNNLIQLNLRCCSYCWRGHWCEGTLQKAFLSPFLWSRRRTPQMHWTPSYNRLLGTSPPPWHTTQRVASPVRPRLAMWSSSVRSWFRVTPEQEPSSYRCKRIARKSWR